MTGWMVRWMLLVVALSLVVMPVRLSAQTGDRAPNAPAAPEIAPNAAPSCTSWSTAHIDCFVIGDDGNVWQISWNGGPTWSDWSNIGFPGLSTDPLGGISVVSRGENSLDLFVVGTSASFGDLYRRTWNGSAWDGWENLGAPWNVNIFETACTSTAAANLECFIRGNDNHLWQRTWNGTTWGAWTDLGVFPSASGLGGLAATTYGTGYIVVYAIGGDGHAYRRYYEMGPWSTWQDDGFPTGFTLRQVACHTLDSATIDCAFTDSAGGVWYRRWTGAGQWGSFTDLGFPPSFSSGVALTHYGEGIVVMSNAQDGRFYRRFREPGETAWSDWIDQGRPKDLRVFLPFITR